MLNTNLDLHKRWKYTSMTRQIAHPYTYRGGKRNIHHILCKDTKLWQNQHIPIFNHDAQLIHGYMDKAHSRKINNQMKGNKINQKSKATYHPKHHKIPPWVYWSVQNALPQNFPLHQCCNLQHSWSLLDQRNLHVHYFSLDSWQLASINHLP